METQTRTLLVTLTVMLGSVLGAYAAQLCNNLLRRGSQNAWTCMHYVEDGFADGYKKTLVRATLGYIQKRHSIYLGVRKRACPDQVFPLTSALPRPGR